MSARALGYASTSIKGDVIQIMGKDGRDAAKPVPNAVMSVLHQLARADLKGSARAGMRVGGLLLAEKPLTIGGFAQAPCLPPSWVDALVVELVEVGGK